MKKPNALRRYWRLSKRRQRQQKSKEAWLARLPVSPDWNKKLGWNMADQPSKAQP